MGIVSWLLYAISSGLWCWALFLPALVEPGGVFRYTGLNCLLMGWFGLFGVVKWALPWLANGFYWIALVGGVIRHNTAHRDLVLSLIGVALALVTFVNKAVPVDGSGREVPITVARGFHVWLAALLISALAHII